MKPQRKVIHMAKHSPTGALVPVVIDEMKDNIILRYHEFTKNRKAFSLMMLQNRWDKSRDDVIDLLHEFEVPGHLNFKEAKKLGQNQQTVDIAIFFEEYIYGIEKMTKMPHNKLKARLFVQPHEAH